MTIWRIASRRDKHFYCYENYSKKFLPVPHVTVLLLRDTLCLSWIIIANLYLRIWNTCVFWYLRLKVALSAPAERWKHKYVSLYAQWLIFPPLKILLTCCWSFSIILFQKKDIPWFTRNPKHVHEHGQTLSITNEVAAQTNFVCLFVWQHLSGGFPQRELGVWSINKSPLSFP